ncbi:HIT zinc finger [Dictyocaulus viviparus]|uniref:HIT zinc finger n=1 Tax=Dictyocaulus viviparus TaxID=29172 RepID=A0A0D8Y451_DICVI|nr:HIT zinc finger [Dictyocaulus viviparus]
MFRRPVVRTTKLRHSARFAAKEAARVLDGAERSSLTNHKLAKLEQDNAHEDPHANIVWRKDLPNFEDEMIGGPKKKGSRKRSCATPGQGQPKRRRKFRARRFRNFISALDEADQKYRNNNRIYRAFFKATAPAPKIRGRKFCAPCGDWGIYTCTRCGTPYCSITCRDIHMDTKCERWIR